MADERTCATCKYGHEIVTDKGDKPGFLRCDWMRPYHWIAPSNLCFFNPPRWENKPSVEESPA